MDAFTKRDLRSEVLVRIPPKLPDGTRTGALAGKWIVGSIAAYWPEEAVATVWLHAGQRLVEVDFPLKEIERIPDDPPDGSPERPYASLPRCAG